MNKDTNRKTQNHINILTKNTVHKHNTCHKTARQLHTLTNTTPTKHIYII